MRNSTTITNKLYKNSTHERINIKQSRNGLIE